MRTPRQQQLAGLAPAGPAVGDRVRIVGCGCRTTPCGPAGPCLRRNLYVTPRHTARVESTEPGWAEGVDIYRLAAVHGVWYADQLEVLS